MRVLQEYDGLNGKVIQWTLKHGNTNHDPGILAWVLDPEGEVLAMAKGELGSASGFVKWLGEMSRASFPLVDPERYTALAQEARAIAARRNLGEVLKGLREKAESETGEALAEAGELRDKLLDYATYRLERAAARKDADPAGALEAYKEIASEFRGDAVGEEADRIHKDLKGDKAFQRELKAGTVLAMIRDLKDGIRADRPLDAPANKKAVAKIRMLMAALERSFADTKVFEKAQALVKELGL